MCSYVNYFDFLTIFSHKDRLRKPHLARFFCIRAVLNLLFERIRLLDPWMKRLQETVVDDVHKSRSKITDTYNKIFLQ